MAGHSAVKRVLVTGAGRGVGAAIAQRFAMDGAVVAVHDRDGCHAAETVNAIASTGGSAFVAAADLANPYQIEAMCKAAIDRMGGVDVVINNAGIISRGSVRDMELGEWSRIMEVNLTAAFLVSKFTNDAVVDAAQVTGYGRYIFISSLSGKSATARESAYCVSKAGVITFARCLAAELAEFGVTVNTICPGWIKTAMSEYVLRIQADEEGQDFGTFYARTLENNMHRVVVEPSDIADAAFFLASESARHITAQDLNVCGGRAFW